MNNISGQISQIEVSGHLSIVSVAITEELQLKAIVVETPATADYLQKGQAIQMLFKETEVVIGNGDQLNISLQNKIPATILHLEKGKLLSKLRLATVAGNINAIISTHAVHELQLQEQQTVTAMVKLNEVMLSTS